MQCRPANTQPTITSELAAWRDIEKRTQGRSPKALPAAQEATHALWAKHNSDDTRHERGIHVDSSQSAPRSDPPRSGVRALVTTILLIAATLGAFVAYLTWGLLSTGDSGDHTTPLLDAQLIVGVAGLIPVAFLGYAIMKKLRRATIALLIVSVATYLAWGLLNDAAVHGWNHLAVF